MSEINKNSPENESSRPSREQFFSDVRFEQHRQGIVHKVRGPTGIICPWCDGKYEEHVKTIKD